MVRQLCLRGKSHLSAISSPAALAALAALAGSWRMRACHSSAAPAPLQPVVGGTCGLVASSAQRTAASRLDVTCSVRLTFCLANPRCTVRAAVQAARRPRLPRSPPVSWHLQSLRDADPRTRAHVLFLQPRLCSHSHGSLWNPGGLDSRVACSVQTHSEHQDTGECACSLRKSLERRAEPRQACQGRGHAVIMVDPAPFRSRMKGCGVRRCFLHSQMVWNWLHG